MAAPVEHAVSVTTTTDTDKIELSETPDGPESPAPESAGQVSGPENDDDEEANGGESLAPRVRDTPQDIRLEAIANTVALHPSRDLLVCGDVDGDVYAFSYSCTEGENRELWSSGHHLKSCRQVRFAEDGLKLYTVSRDKSVHLMDVEQGKLVTRIRGAHSAPINSLLLVDENILATGDDGGTMKVWT